MGSHDTRVADSIQAVGDMSKRVHTFEQYEPIAYPTVEETHRRIGEIRRVVLQSESIDSLKAKLSDLLVITSSGYLFRPEDTKLYRGRKVGRKPTSIRELSYPPPNATKLGRANRDGRPMFYCCTAPGVIAFELGLSAGDLLAISTWTINEPLACVAVGYSNGNLARLGSPRQDPRQQASGAIPKQMTLDVEREENRLMDEFLSEYFTKKVSSGEEAEYAFSIATAELFTSADAVNAILYPAVSFNGVSDNLAILPLFVDRFLQPTEIEFVWVTDVTPDKMSGEVLSSASGILNDGTIVWRDTVSGLV